MLKIKIVLPLLSIALFSTILLGQEHESYKVLTVGFYNVENLFDYQNDPKTWDDDFTPTGDHSWGETDYREKIIRLARTIALIGSDLTGTPPVIMGLCEVENDRVLRDLIEEPPLKERDFGIVHFDSPDRRGIDVALIYQTKLFIPTHQRHVEVIVYNDELDRERIFTRDILHVSGLLDGEKVHILVNHWPSRRGGELKSRHRRIRAAQYTRRIVDSLWSADPYSKIIIMGDFNDDPTSYSISKVLGTHAEKKNLKLKSLYNPMEEMYRKGLGTLAWRDNWNLFDQLIVSSTLTGTDYRSYQLYQAGIFNKRFLSASRGKYKGYPYRSFDSGRYTGGYSDHFPVFIHLIKKTGN